MSSKQPAEGDVKSPRSAIALEPERPFVQPLHAHHTRSKKQPVQCRMAALHLRAHSVVLEIVPANGALVSSVSVDSGLNDERVSTA